MKNLTRTFFLTIAFFVMCSSAYATGPLIIKALPCTITLPGSYALAKSLGMAADTAHGVTINADNVTIDLMGYTLSGPNLSSVSTNNGIYINGHKNIEIKNGSIINFDTDGIYATGPGPDNIRVLNVRVISNESNGIYLEGNGNVVTGCTVAENVGLGLDGGLNSTISSNCVYGNASGGIHGIQCTITGNTANSNGFGISANYSMITGNTVSNNLSSGIQAYNAKIESNYVYDNNLNDGSSYGGISAQWCTIKGNTVSSNNIANIISNDGNIIEGNNLILSMSGGAAIKFVGGSSYYTGNRLTSNSSTFVNSGGTGVDGGGNINF